MRYSIVIPTYNEEQDIRATLDRLLGLDWPDLEIIVVDDSTDSTPQIVGEYADRGVQLIRPAVREGRCGARNIGIRAASGEVVIVLNADVLLPRDFIHQIAPHYAAGYDAVAVHAEVENLQDLFARYTHCEHLATTFRRPETIGWSEGFSCRRALAIESGMFPTGYSVPICAGEDGYFVDNLDRVGARRTTDLSIHISHIAPGDMVGFWKQRHERGYGTPQIRYFIMRKSLNSIRVRAALRILQTAARTVTIAPILWKVARITRESDRGLRDFPGFLLACLVQHAGFHFGEWRSIGAIAKAERRRDTSGGARSLPANPQLEPQ